MKNKTNAGKDFGHKIHNNQSSSAFALYIEHFAYYCSFYFTPFRHTNSDFGYIEEGESTAGYTFGIFCLPWHKHAGTRNLDFTSHSKDEAIEVKLLAQGHKRGGSRTGIEPTQGLFFNFMRYFLFKKI
jgi:hypothetical protein